MNETAVKTKIRNFLKKTHITQEANTPGYGARAGRPDLSLLWGPFCVHVEVKKEKGKRRKSQIAWKKIADSKYIPTALAEKKGNTIVFSYLDMCVTLDKNTTVEDFESWYLSVCDYCFVNGCMPDLRRLLPQQLRLEEEV